MSDSQNKFVVYLRITENCNAKCFMCRFAQENRNLFISNEQLDYILTYARNNNVRLIRFTGGEPLLDANLPLHIQRCNSLGIKTSAITNGLLLSKQIDKLVSSGLNQIIISVDGSIPELHNRIRGTLGLLENIEEALLMISKKYPSLLVRINTVVSPENLHDLPNIARWLMRYGVHQWSIIPIKLDENPWKDLKLDIFLECYLAFSESIKSTNIRLMGYSDQWAGSNITECVRFYNGDYFVRPKCKCNLAKMVSFYDPFTNRFYPCNCTPHRKNERSDIDNYNEMASWYYENGGRYCKGCEPINAYCADFPETLHKSIFNF